jgi:hypothetical protein
MLVNNELGKAAFVAAGHSRQDKIWRAFRNFVPEFGVDGEAFFGRILASV